ncbi:hypothetical protein [Sphingomonas pokkalii]|nr:hypothetical protein [Sphingomonas pokkalii]
MLKLMICGLLAATSVSASAQDAAAVAPAQASRTMPANTLLVVTPAEEISSKKIDVGSKVKFVTIGDITEQGAVVIPRGSMVSGDITFKTGKAIGGKSGKFEVAFRTVQVRGTEYALTGVHRQEGKGNTAAALLGSILVSGRSAVMKPGDEGRAFTAAPIPY